MQNKVSGGNGAHKKMTQRMAIVSFSLCCIEQIELRRI